MTHPVYYAIGDIHGEFAKLQILHGRILRHHASNFAGREMCLVHLGDYVDRGPESYEVINCLIELETSADFQVINLKGNHEVMMVEGLSFGQKEHDFWTKWGGLKTLKSYRAAGFQDPPARHLKWMAGLPSYHWDEAAKLVFVHAGIDPAQFPKDGEEVHLWTRSREFFDTHDWANALPEGTKVVHGHTPTKSKTPDVVGTRYTRINVDTGACYGGDLTAAILDGSTAPTFLRSGD